MSKLLVPPLLALSLTACSSQPMNWSPGNWSVVHRIDIQQGNVLEQAAVDRLVPGMDYGQVRYLMGSPLLEDIFHNDRWDYLYWLDDGEGQREQKRLTLHFEAGRLASLEGDLMPRDNAPEPEARQQNLLVPPQTRRDDRGILTRMWNALFRADVGI